MRKCHDMSHGTREGQAKPNTGMPVPRPGPALSPDRRDCMHITLLKRAKSVPAVPWTGRGRRRRDMRWHRKTIFMIPNLHGLRTQARGSTNVLRAFYHLRTSHQLCDGCTILIARSSGFFDPFRCHPCAPSFPMALSVYIRTWHGISFLSASSSALATRCHITYLLIQMMAFGHAPAARIYLSICMASYPSSVILVSPKAVPS